MWSENWRVNIDYYSREYDDRMMEISSPYTTEEEARKEYERAVVEEKCFDADCPARCELIHYVWQSPNEYARNEVLAQNY